MLNKIYKAKIIEVLPGSVAENYGLEPGDFLLAIDNNPVRDLLDYQFYIADTEQLSILIKKANGIEFNIDIKKKANEDLGLVFDSAVFDKIKLCNNNCIFCFVDQQPPGLRETLYVKDDDYRLSYLQGTYITLTNLTKADMKRIEQLRLGPLFVSVHTTNPDIRIKMLNNVLAGEIMKKLRWLEDLDIPVHTQIVVCPGYNDSTELRKTLIDLSSLENVQSVAIVPVGMTIYRQDKHLAPFTEEIAIETIEIIEELNDELGKNFAFPADEIYLMAKRDLPMAKFYENFPQLEDGVGSTRLTLEDFSKLKLPTELRTIRNIGIVTASLARNALSPIFDKLSQIGNLNLAIIEIDNAFWGNMVSVCGLVVGADIIKKLEALDKIPEEIFIPSVMLRRFTEEFIDGIKVSDIEEKFKIKVHIVKNFYSFREVINELNR